MESQHVSSLTARSDALMRPRPQSYPTNMTHAYQRQRQQQRGEAQRQRGEVQQPGTGWPATLSMMSGYTAPAPVADPGAGVGAVAAAAYGRWAYEHATQAQQQQQHAPPPQAASPPQPPSGAAWQGVGSGYWPVTAGSRGYYAAAPATASGGGGGGGSGGGSDTSDSSDDGGGGGGGAGLRKAIFRKKGSATAHHHAASVAAAVRETSELERRLKKNAREQKRANKINDQIAIMKSILEDVGLRPPATKSSILSEGIAMVRHLLAWTDPEKLAALRAKATGGMLGPGGGAGNGDETVVSMETGGGSESLGSAGGGGGVGLQEPYVLLFRKSATPLAMAGPDGAHRFLDCNTRFAEVLQMSPLELQQATVFTFTRERDYDNTRRVLALVSQPGPLADEIIPLEVVLTNPHGQRFLVRVLALMDDADKPCYLLFTPKGLLQDSDADEEPDRQGARKPTGHGHGNGNGHHVIKDKAPNDAPPSASAKTMGSAASSATSSPALGLAQGSAVAGVTSSEGSSIGSANSSSNSLYHSSPRGGAALAGTTEAAMAAARTLPSHVKPMI